MLRFVYVPHVWYMKSASVIALKNVVLEIFVEKKEDSILSEIEKESLTFIPACKP